MLRMRTPKYALELLLNTNPKLRNLLKGYSQLSRQDQLELRNSILIHYPYGGFNDLNTSLSVGMVGAMATGLIYAYLMGEGYKITPGYANFFKKLAGAFLGGNIGKTALASYYKNNHPEAIRDEVQESFIVGSMTFAGAEAVGLTEIIFDRSILRGYQDKTEIDAATPLYLMYCGWNITSIFYDIFWRNEYTKAFDEMYPLKPMDPKDVMTKFLLIQQPKPIVNAKQVSSLKR